MGYIIALVILVVVVPLIFLMLSRGTAGGGGMRPGSRSVTREVPSADEATPGEPGAVNQPRPGSERRIPPA